jgi:hypothetical protein
VLIGRTAESIEAINETLVLIESSARDEVVATLGDRRVGRTLDSTHVADEQIILPSLEGAG